MGSNIVSIQVQAIVDQAVAALNRVAASSTEAGVAISEGMASAEATAATASGTIVINLNSISKKAEETAAETGFSIERMEEKFRELAEGAELSALGSVRAFSLLSQALGGGFVVVLAGEMLNKFKETEVELGHFSEATGISAAKIAELKASMEEVGTPGDKLDSVLQRLSRAIAQASMGSERTITAFHRMGVETDGWAEKTPDAINVLMQLSDHFSSSEKATRDLGNAQQLLGRNIISMVGFLKQGSEVIGETMDRYKSLGEAQEAAISSAMQLQKQEAQLGAEFKTLVAEVFPSVVIGFDSIVTAVKVVSLGLRILEEAVLVQMNIWYQFVDGIVKAGEALHKGNFAGAAFAMKESFRLMEEGAKSGLANIQKDSQSTYDEIAKLWSKPPAEGKKKDKGDDEVGDDSKLRIAQIEAAAAQQKALLEIAKEGIEADARMHQISEAEKISRLSANTAAELAVQKTALVERLAIAREDPDHPENVAKLLGEVNVLRSKQIANQIKGNSEVAAAQEKAADLEIKLVEKTQEEVNKINQKTAAEALKLSEKKAADAEKAATEILTAEEHHSKATAALARSRVDAEFSAGLLTEAQHATMLRNIENMEYESIKRIMNERILALGGEATNELAALAKLHAQQEAAQDAHNLALEKIDDAHLKKTEKAWQDLMRKEGQDFMSLVQGILTGQETIIQGALKMTQKMLSDWISYLTKKLLQHILHTALIQNVEAAMMSILQALHLANAATTASTGAAERATQVVGEANVGAASAWAATAAIPFIGPELAPGAAAATFAGIMAFLPGATAEKGGIFGKETLTLLHPQEMVLPAAESKTIQNLAVTGGGGGSVHLHMNLLDGQHAADFVERHGDRLMDLVRAGMREGKLA